MDLNGVDYVLLYDAPRHLSSYVHKVGRTARAGKPGTAITLLEHKQVFFFKRMIEQIQGNSQKSTDGQESPASKHRIKEIKIARSQLRPLQTEYRESLVKLKGELAKTGPSANKRDDTKRDTNGDRAAENMDTVNGEEDEKPDQGPKRKKKFITNTKFLKRLKQIKKMNE
jgi:superfamily II DNA/RNA helicase